MLATAGVALVCNGVGMPLVTMATVVVRVPLLSVVVVGVVVASGHLDIS